MPQGPFPGGVTPGFPALQATYAPRSAGFSGGVIDQVQGDYAGFASATLTVTGTVGAGPTATVTVGGTAVLYTYIAGDTTTTLAAAHIAAAINANSTLIPLVLATPSTNTVVVTSLVAGLPGMLSLTVTPTGGAVLAISNSYNELDFANLVFPKTTFSYAAPGSAGDIVFYASEPREVDAFTRADLKAQGLVY